MKIPETFDSEEDNAIEECIVLPCKSLELRSNPLLQNKGLPKLRAKTLVNPPTSSDIKKMPKKYSPAFPEYSIKSSTGYDVEMAEFGSACELSGIKEIMTIPLSEMNLEYLTYRKKGHKQKGIVYKPKEEKKSSDSLPNEDKQIKKEVTLTRLRSMTLPDDGGMAIFAEDLTPKQFNFLKRVYACKDNYYIRTLSVPEVNNQYMSIFRYLKKLSASEVVLKQLKNLENNAESFKKDVETYKGM